MQPEQTDFDTALCDDTVLAYLVRNPDFFLKNKEILPRLRIPHESGAAVSLIEKQVSVLRNKCGHLENSLRDFIAVARENEHLHQRLHGLIQDVITAPSLNDIIDLSRTSLQENFNADGVHFMLIATPPKRASRKKAAGAAAATGKTKTAKAMESARKTTAVEGLKVVGHTHKHIRLFKSLFSAGQTVCGMPDKAQLDCLIGKDHAHVASAALIPLHFERRLGVLMLTSRDESRFAAGKGVMFLNQLGDLLGRRLHSYGTIEKAGAK